MTTGAALATLVVPFGSAAFAQGLEVSDLGVDIEKVTSPLQGDGDEQEGLGDVVEGALTELLAPADSDGGGGGGGGDGGGAALPGDGGREMGGADGGNMTPVEEPSGGGAAPSGAQASSQPSSPPPAGDQAGESRGAASAGAGGGYAAGPRLQQWFSRTAPSIDHFAGPLVAPPMVVPAPAYAEAASVAGLGSSTVDGWAMTSTPLHSTVHLNPYTPTEWPLAVAAGLLLLVAGGHVLRLYDRRWKAGVVQASNGPHVTSTE